MHALSYNMKSIFGCWRSRKLPLQLWPLCERSYPCAPLFLWFRQLSRGYGSGHANMNLELHTCSDLLRLAMHIFQVKFFKPPLPNTVPSLYKRNKNREGCTLLLVLFITSKDFKPFILLSCISTLNAGKCKTIACHLSLTIN